MTIFARLVCMIFSIAASAGLAGMAVFTSGWGHGKEQAAAIAAGLGAVAGIMVGKAVGDSVVGKLPKD
jgi:hypothetical protein